MCDSGGVGRGDTDCLISMSSEDAAEKTKGRLEEGARAEIALLLGVRSFLAQCHIKVIPADVNFRRKGQRTHTHNVVIK